MTLGSGSQSESALLAYNKRKAQLERWRGSDTEKESIEIRSRPKRVKFADKCIFQAACASNDKGQVARMIKEGYDINAVDEDGITALHQACIEDNFDMVEFLLENGADVNISDNEGWTPLHAVATCCYVSIAKLLMEHGANVVALNNDCSIPLDICKSDEIRELFIQEINGKGIDLKDARRGEEVKMMDDAKRWLANGAVDENPHPVTGATAMHVAACKGYIKVLDLLIKAGANMNSQDFDGWTPLHAAAHWGQKEACEVLLEHMCDMGLRNNCDQTALDIADSSVVPLLEEWKKRHDVNKNIDTHNVGKQNLNNLNNNNNNAVTVPPKKKPAPRPTPDDDVTIVTSQLSQDKSPSNISNSISDEPCDQDEEMEVEEEQEQMVDVVDVDEAEDTLASSRPTPPPTCVAPEPISFAHPPPPLCPPVVVVLLLVALLPVAYRRLS
ncbi:Protein phosphatase 1 regulatory subunit 12B [Orchesella cincta]|uniref:Protein phosphatase 1 regulatory subunit 12B n=1 Tax=Orchesella cincta TaxID=48709 RepID=A0A1D2MHE7_ORCCI|nr:Protein phosphatase 1 regulatory subunit 12B [Orchesella cincta]